jgi:hypothetical protein
MNILLDSTKLKPLSTKGLDIPDIEIPKIFNPVLLRCVTPSSPKRSKSPFRLIPIDNYENKIAKFGNIEYSNKRQIIDNFDMGYFSFMFWTCIHTKTLGTFLVVKTLDSKMNFISMRHKLYGCNFQYDNVKKCIYTKNCDGCESKILDNTLYYDFPEEIIILTPDNPYDVPNILSKM